ncbi:hypothetical protein E4T50_08923 [Aureobasidium sp. EXF-12298]|nr:hypothetical protein E4T50_08923 [Aureobasidium sp. EXF-12298]
MDHLRNTANSASVFLNGSFFSTSFKIKMHWIQLTLVVTIIILTGVRISIRPSTMPVTRSDTLAIVMGIKTIVVIGYQLLTTHVSNLRRWRNLKVYLVLNSMEVLFWFVVVVITGMGMSRYCQGAYCGLSVVMLLIALTLTTFALWTAIATRKLRREARYAGQADIPSHEAQTQSVPNKAAEISGHAMSQV